MKATVTTVSFLAFIFLATSVVHGVEIRSPPCGDDSWIPYKDEKCFKLFQTFMTRREAQEHCNQQASTSDTPSLVIINSATEQIFLNQYIFNTSDSNSVWIGAERLPDSRTEFEWIDGSPVERFTNWKIGSPSDIVGRQCVQMHSIYTYTRELSDLEWVDISCNGASWFVCQKMQAWSIVQLQRAILNTRMELRHSVDDLKDQMSDMLNLIIDMKNEMTDSVNELRNEIRSETVNRRSEITVVSSELTNEIRSETTNVRNEMTSTTNSLNSQLQTLQSNPVPIGFIYVQLSGQPEPRNIWSTVTWTEVTSQYAGLFFRAAGGGSAAFGSTQEEFSPRITQITSLEFSGAIIRTLTPNGFISVGARPPTDHWGLYITQSTGEVRPRNSAIRIWRRSQ